ncbi:MAG: O-antigen translocase [Bacteroidetes bacterium]|nr:O-antigen translocase [Bacteroidota bacterium]
MSDQQSSYRQIMKATSLFGGVQVFNILIAIIRSKFIAVLLGPAGMGIAGLLNSTTNFIGALTSFGIGTSAVKNVAIANGSGNQIRIAIVIKVLRQLVWYTGSLGAIITLLLSPWLSEITFGNRDYTLAFIWISITLLFNQLTVGRMVILQGMQKLQYLAKASLSGSLFGLVITVPLYYRYGVDGIIPAIIFTSVIAFFFSWFFSRKVRIESIKLSKIRTFAEGKNMLIMGFMVSLSGLITLGTSYIVRIYISNTGGVEEVGLYTAGFTIINTYVGLVLTAMATDYYPRLSAVAYDNKKCTEAINHQAEIVLLILAPIIVVFLVFIKWVIIILYSTKFVTVDAMIHWAALGMLFRAASWAVSFVFISKGDAKLFFWNELIANIYALALNILGYHFFGLTGLGISFLITYLLYLIQVFLIAKKQYSFSFSNTFLKVFSFQLLLAISCFLTMRFIIFPYSYFLGGIMIIISVFYSYKALDKFIGLKELIKNVINRYLKK